MPSSPQNTNHSSSSSTVPVEPPSPPKTSTKTMWINTMMANSWKGAPTSSPSSAKSSSPAGAGLQIWSASPYQLNESRCTNPSRKATRMTGSFPVREKSAKLKESPKRQKEPRKITQGNEETRNSWPNRGASLKQRRGRVPKNQNSSQLKSRRRWGILKKRG